MKKILFAITIALFACAFLFSQSATSSEIITSYSDGRTVLISILPSYDNLSIIRRKVDYNIRDSVDNFGNLYIRYQSYHPSVLTYANNDGSIVVCASDDAAGMTYIYEFNQNLTETRTMSFKNEIGSLGAFTIDSDRNYYFFYAARSANRNAENMTVVKYNNAGEKLNTYLYAKSRIPG